MWGAFGTRVSRRKPYPEKCAALCEFSVAYIYSKEIKDAIKYIYAYNIIKVEEQIIFIHKMFIWEKEILGPGGGRKNHVLTKPQSVLKSSDLCLKQRLTKKSANKAFKIHIQ